MHPGKLNQRFRRIVSFQRQRFNVEVTGEIHMPLDRGAILRREVGVAGFRLNGNRKAVRLDIIRHAPGRRCRGSVCCCGAF